MGVGETRVVGDCVRCPFHGWCFGPDGSLRSVPSADSPPSTARTSIASWPCMERNGVVSVWMNSRAHVAKFAADAAGTCSHSHHATAAAADDDINPSPPPPPHLASESVPVPNNTPWHGIPSFPEADGPFPRFAFHGYTENVVDAHIFDIAENGADVSHLAVVHSVFIAPSLSPFLSHSWVGTWTPAAKGSGREHIADMTVRESVCVAGIPLPGEVQVRIEQVGPAHVYLRMETPVGSLFVCETVTPVSPHRLRVMHAVYASPWVPRILVKAVMGAHIVHHEKDVPVWSNKRYAPSATGGAVLLRTDAAISSYRTWCRQFYNEVGGEGPGGSAASISYQQALKQHLADSLGVPQDLAGEMW
jgi:cholesterol 7-dehydrogenase